MKSKDADQFWSVLKAKLNIPTLGICAFRI